MPTEQRLTPTRRALARLLAAWLIVLLALQALAAAGALIIGPLHRHLPALAASVHSNPQDMLDPSRAKAAGRAHTHAHAHAHDVAQRHHHDPADNLTRPPTAAEPGGETALAQALLAAMLALLTIGAHGRLGDRLRHVWAPTRLWALLAWQPAPARRPPRA